MSTDVETNIKNSFVKAEPVLAAALATAIIAFVLSVLQTHGIISGVQASSLTKVLQPPVVALALLVFGFVLRRFVRPAGKAAQWLVDEVNDHLGPEAVEQLEVLGKDAVAAMISEWDRIATGKAAPTATVPATVAAPKGV